LAPRRLEEDALAIPPRFGAGAADTSDFGGLVSGDFHTDANFDNHRGRPSHCCFLRLELADEPSRFLLVGAQTRFSTASRAGRFEPAASLP